jgi:hypothetical protein
MKKSVWMGMCTLVVMFSASMGTLAFGNLVVNGDFEAGNTGFTTAYTYMLIPDPPQSYTMNSNPHNVHPMFASYGDHTTGSGTMMVVNGAVAEDATLWEQSISVQAGEIYQLSFWSSTCFAMNPAMIACYVNGELLGTTEAPGTTGNWIETMYIWHSGLNDVATIRLVDTRQTLDGSGDDFALDDITFVPEPATMALLALGGVMLRRRMR